MSGNRPRPAWPLLATAYALVARLIAPWMARRVTARLAEQGVAADRLPERRGKPGLPRPPGRLVWFHGASIGETLSILPLVRGLTAEGTACLVTSGTAASARILSQRLPDGAVHQFAPLDAPGYVARFLRHWQPDLLVLAESELWPVTLRALDRRGIPRILMNARLSDRSLAAWGKRPALARAVFGGFAAVLAQDEAGQAALQRLGAEGARLGGNLKAAAGAPPADPGALADLKGRLSGRPVWAAISTHPGEHEMALAAHRLVLQALPEALLILCPRHPEEAQIAALDLRLARRSAGETPEGAQVWLADSFGETGLWLRLAPVVFLGGSLVPVGGHNPWEPAGAGAALLTGPHLATVTADMARLAALGAARVLERPEDLGPAVLHLLHSPDEARAMGAAGQRAQAAEAEAEARALALIRATLRPKP